MSVLFDLAFGGRAPRAVRTRRVIAVASLALASCAHRGGHIPYARAGFVAPTLQTSGAMEQDLPLGPLDRVRIDVFRVADLSGEYRVGADGTLELPLIGRVSVRDQTPEQVARALERRYGQRYLNNPNITVQVLDSGQRNITVEGGVNQPGIYQTNGTTTLLGAIALAKGVHADDANPRQVAVFRKVNGNTMAAAFDLVAIRHGDTADPSIFPGDTIVVNTSGTRAWFRDLLQAVSTLAIFTKI